jgi:2-oxoglutarate dehydrogenase E2 component (dihydrolipoamide succinyltransferase)
VPQTEVIMPRMGESVNEATIIKWLKKEGDAIKADETLVDIATDKVDSEIPSPANGVIIKLLCKEGDVIPVGKAIAIIDSANGVSEPVISVSVMETPKKEPEPQKHSQFPTEPARAGTIPDRTGTGGHNSQLPITRFSSSGRFYSPLVRNIAKKEGITVTELETIAGTGKEGRVTKTDLLSYIKAPPPPERGNIKPAPLPPKGGTAKVGPNDEIIEMDRMRRLIAEHMVMSKHTSPHVTSYVEADVTGIVVWRNRVKGAFEKREKEKLSFMPVFAEAVIKAIRDFPMINVSVDGTRIIRHRDINLGMAVALPSGNLIVPVIRNADQKNLLGLTKSINDLANRARNNKLIPDDTQDGTFTITNVGTFGNIMGTPIIPQPQAAILATGIIRKKPVVIESPFGDTIGIRSMMYLSLSYDHRVVDGFLGGSFVKKIADYLEAFDINREI